MYGILKISKYLTQKFEIAKRYREGDVFIILIYDDIFNTQRIRDSIETISNDKFFAVFRGIDNILEYKSIKDFINKIKENLHDYSNGNINFDEGSGIKYYKSYISRLAIENLVTYLIESKIILNHILSILFGYSPERFFGAYEGTSTRKTRYYKNRRHNKGIITLF